MSYTHIDHDVRRQLGISMNEYAVLDLIARLSCNPKYPFCIMSAESIANDFDLSRQSVMNIFASLESKGHITRDGQKKIASERAYNLIIAQDKGVKKVDRGVKKVDRWCKESLHNNDINNNISIYKRESENFLPDYVQESRAKVALNDVSQYKALPFSERMEGARQAFSDWLDDQHERGKKVTRAQCEINIKALEQFSDVQQAINAIQYSIIKGYPKFYDNGAGKNEGAKHNEVARQSRAGKTDARFGHQLERGDAHDFFSSLGFGESSAGQ